MDLTPEDRIKNRLDESEAAEKIERKEEKERRAESDRRHAADVPGLLDAIPALARSVAARISERDAEFKQAVVVTYRTRPRGSVFGTKKSIAGWYLLCPSLENILTYLTRDGELIESITTVPWTRRLDLSKLSYHQLQELREEIEAVESRVFLLEDLEALARRDDEA